MNSTLATHRSPRCTATSKRTGLPCQAPAVTGWTICRFHGARGGGPNGERNGAYRDGQHTAVAVAERRAVAALLRRAQAGVLALGDDG
jgi:hypothetical protein